MGKLHQEDELLQTAPRLPGKKKAWTYSRELQYKMAETGTALVSREERTLLEPKLLLHSHHSPGTTSSGDPEPLSRTLQGNPTIGESSDEGIARS